MRIFYLFILIAAFSCQNKNTHLPKAYNVNASIVNGSFLKPLQKNMLNVFIDQNKKTISALYANDPAVNFLKVPHEKSYPDGSILYMVTWKAQTDPRWFGGNIPDSAISLETVEFNNGPHYTYYEGSPLRMIGNPDADSKMQWILQQKAVLLP